MMMMNHQRMQIRSLFAESFWDFCVLFSLLSSTILFRPSCPVRLNILSIPALLFYPAISCPVFCYSGVTSPILSWLIMTRLVLARPLIRSCYEFSYYFLSSLSWYSVLNCPEPDSFIWFWSVLCTPLLCPNTGRNAELKSWHTCICSSLHIISLFRVLGRSLTLILMINCIGKLSSLFSLYAICGVQINWMHEIGPTCFENRYTEHVLYIQCQSWRFNLLVSWQEIIQATFKKIRHRWG